jgi:glutamate 5-kinase
MKKRIVIKIGTGVITDKKGKLDKKVIGSIVGQMCSLLKKGIDVLLVSSGAIGAGMGLLGKKKRSKDLAELQSMASIGQVHLMDIYNKYFKKYKYHAGQILLTQEDFTDKGRYLNIKHTINTLLKHNAVPIINENDTVATEEIKCGDNDRISALVADIVEADMLIILTTVDGLLDKDGNTVKHVESINKKVYGLIRSEKSTHGTGGMKTKLAAADYATKAGIECFFANGKKTGKILKVVNKEDGFYTKFDIRKT